MSVLLLVLGALLSGLESMTSAERTTSGRVDDEQSLRLTLSQLTRDVRDADTIEAQPSLSAYATTLDVQLAGAHVRWIFDPAAHSLSRLVVGDDSSAQATAVESGVAGATFTWFDAAGRSVATQPWATPGDVAACVTEVGVIATLSAAPHRAGVTESVQTAVRNQHPPAACA